MLPAGAVAVRLAALDPLALASQPRHARATNDPLPREDRLGVSVDRPRSTWAACLAAGVSLSYHGLIYIRPLLERQGFAELEAFRSSWAACFAAGRKPAQPCRTLPERTPPGGFPQRLERVSGDRAFAVSSRTSDLTNSNLNPSSTQRLCERLTRKLQPRVDKGKYRLPKPSCATRERSTLSWQLSMTRPQLERYRSQLEYRFAGYNHEHLSDRPRL